MKGFPRLTPEQQQRKVEAIRAHHAPPPPTLPAAPYDDWAVAYAEDVRRPHCFTNDQPRSHPSPILPLPRVHHL